MRELGQNKEGGEAGLDGRGRQGNMFDVAV